MSTVVHLAPPNQTDLSFTPREERRARRALLEQATPERAGDWFLFGGELDLRAFAAAVQAATLGLSPTGREERGQVLRLPTVARG